MGKVLKVPVYQLLGGLYRDRLEAYVSDVYWEKDSRSMAENLERILKKGFKKRIRESAYRYCSRKEDRS